MTLQAPHLGGGGKGGGAARVAQKMALGTRGKSRHLGPPFWDKSLGEAPEVCS